MKTVACAVYNLVNISKEDIMKKFIGIMLALVMMLSLAACGGGETTTSTPAPTTTTTEAPAEGEATEVAGLTEPIAEQPVLLTSVGQSADVEMVKSMIDKNGTQYVMNNLATADDIGDAKTLVLAVGGSSKGLGAAGIDANQEIDRVNALVDAADEKGLTIIAVHIGGEARRGELSDKFIGPSFAKADYAIVVESGDADGMMAGLARENSIPIDLIGSMTDAVTFLKNAFK